ncbi:unnamed protein product [Oppiella nova]|uniref:Curli production assembly/transport component CsgG n=1 Tax=Oppiella nova TaxID=334625 RepID=A0A7R9QUR5_9ACAR|nr:unnamed protein product [Oppiella nova]CAG2175733.1 unnamed protein product [Oppiella nova]
MMKTLIAMMSVVVVMSAQPITQSNDHLETIANQLMQSIGLELSGNHTLNAFLVKTDASKRRQNEVQSNEEVVVLEGIGSIGATIVSVRRGKSSVTVTNAYGLGAGAVLDITAERNGIQRQVDESQRLKQLTQPLYDKYVKSVEEKKSSEDDIVVVIEGGKAGEEVIATKEGYLIAKGAVGFKLGSITSITKSQ